MVYLAILCITCSSPCVALCQLDVKFCLQHTYVFHPINLTNIIWKFYGKFQHSRYGWFHIYFVWCQRKESVMKSELRCTGQLQKFYRVSNWRTFTFSQSWRLSWYVAWTVIQLEVIQSSLLVVWGNFYRFGCWCEPTILAIFVLLFQNYPQLSITFFKMCHLIIP